MMKRMIAFAVLVISVAVNAQNTPLWLRYPAISPDGKTIVFSYKGDLYKVPTSGGDAYPLTIHEAYDYMPLWSHDGKWIGFASDLYGNFGVYIMLSNCGVAKSLKYNVGNFD